MDKWRAGYAFFEKGIVIAFVLAWKLLKLTVIMVAGALIWPLLVDRWEGNYEYKYNAGRYSSLEGCVLNEVPQERHPYSLNLSAEECRFVSYSGGSVVSMLVEYPGLEVVRDRLMGESAVTFYLVYVAPEVFDRYRSFFGVQPKIMLNEIQTLEVETQRRKFSGSDGSLVYVSGMGVTLKAMRIFNEGARATYQYSQVYTDIRAMDDFAIAFLNKIKRE